MRAKGHELFDVPAKPRRKPRVLMHAAHVGHHDSVFRDVAQWRCSRCGHETDWVPAPTTNERQPCPRRRRGRARPGDGVPMEARRGLV